MNACGCRGDPLWGDRFVSGPLVISHKEGVTALPEGMRALAMVTPGKPQAILTTM